MECSLKDQSALFSPVPVVFAVLVALLTMAGLALLLFSLVEARFDPGPSFFIMV